MREKTRAAGAVDLFALARGCYGVLLICVPQRMVGVCTRHPASPRALRVIRVLGARHLIQALLSRPSAPELEAGCAVDTAHAASMFGLGLASRALRKPALADACVATGMATFGLLTARRLRG
ncbi:MAG TPA: hypothetical protein VGS62_04530 [Streptosporangiaceae bacterium]|nr:hypothetical protein [Streptosporangiaceae bacterium]